MLKEKAGALAGQIWEALNGTEGLTQKQIKKATKLKADKDFFLGLGWPLREDKVVTSEVEGEIFVKLV
ncbi:winged helix-turn-helix domain-containing protein [Phocaeicola vulgatus]|nr:winged helix-turn-helix domain-containing protein [Phocaeicola vulgatus]